MNANFGEKLAARYLERLGYMVVHTNWTCQWGEIDIICMDPSRTRLIFVEVKYRSSTKYGYGFESISYHKKKKLIRTINIFLNMYGLYDKQWFFEVISITKLGGRYKLHYFKKVGLV